MIGWRKLFPVILLLTCVDGFFVNLFYPSRLALLAKDIFILIVYILFILEEPVGQWISQFKRRIGFGTWYLAMLFIIVGLIQIYNPQAPNIAVGVLGFKIMFFYWPLAILSYAYIDSPNDAQRLLKAVVYLSIPICIFGLIQFWEDPDFMVRVFGQGFRRALLMTTTFGTGTKAFLRVIGTFVASGQFGLFLVANTMFILGLLFTARNKAEKFIMIGCSTLSYVTLLATGSRGSSLLLFASIFVFVIFCRWLWRAFFIILVLGISFNFGFNYLGRAVTARFHTVQDIKMIRARTIETTSFEFKKYLEKYPFGKGMGTGSIASRYVAEGSLRELGYTENYLSKLQYELGISGVILFYFFLLALTLRWIRHWFKSLDRTNYVIIAALSAYCFVILGSSFIGIIDSPPTGIFLWVMIGMVAKVSALPSDDKHPLSA